jgi:hypothetical protein
MRVSVTVSAGIRMQVAGFTDLNAGVGCGRRPVAGL